jgi:tetratricopeptide (TPR) repeat protein
LELELSVRMNLTERGIDVWHSLMNRSGGQLALQSFRLTFDDGTDVDGSVDHSDLPELAGFVDRLKTGGSCWFRASIWYVSDTRQRGVLVQDHCVRGVEGSDELLLDAYPREEEARATLAFVAQEFEKAAAHFQAALLDYERSAGLFSIRQLLITYAYVLIELNRLDEAGGELRSMLAVTAGDREPRITMRLLANLGTLLTRQQQPLAARSAFLRVLELAAQLDDDSLTGMAKAGIGVTYFHEGHLAEAETWLRQGVDIGRASQDRLVLSRRLRNLALVLAHRGEHQKTKQLLVEAIDAVIAGGMFDDAETEQLCKQLLEACQATQDTACFVPVVERLLASLPERTAPERRMIIMNALASQYAAQNQFAAAAEIEERALAMARGRGNAAPALIACSINLAEFYSRMNRPEHAKDAFLEAMQLAAKERAWMLARRCQKRVAEICRANGEEDPSETLYAQAVADWWFSQNSLESTESPDAASSDDNMP